MTAIAMSKVPDYLDEFVQQASKNPALLDPLCDQITPIMMHISLPHVQKYRIALEPLLDSMEKETDAYSYLVIIIAFLLYRDSRYTEVIDFLHGYELEFEKTFSDGMKVSIHALIGASYRSLGQTEFALESFQRNIPYTQIERNDHSYFYSLTLYHIAELYGELKEYEAMLNRHLLSLEFFTPNDKKDFLYRSLNGIGRAYQGLKDYDGALKYLLDVENNIQETSNIPLRARNLNDLGKVYAELGMVDHSLAHFEKAIDLRQSHKLHNASISTQMEMARVMIDAERLEDAITLLEMAFEVAKELDVKKKQFGICKMLSEAYEKNNEIEQAFLYHKQFYSIKESIENVTYTQAENQRIREVNTILEVQKKLIEEQKVQIEESHRSIQALNESLEALVDDRTRQLQHRNQQLKRYAFMNAHEVRGPLTTILGLIHIAGEFKSLEEKNDLIQMIETSALKLDNIIRSLNDDLMYID